MWLFRMSVQGLTARAIVFVLLGLLNKGKVLMLVESPEFSKTWARLKLGVSCLGKRTTVFHMMRQISFISSL